MYAYDDTGTDNLEKHRSSRKEQRFQNKDRTR